VGRAGISELAWHYCRSGSQKKEQFDWERYKTDREFRQKVDEALKTEKSKDYDLYAQQERQAGREPLSRMEHAVTLARAGSPQPEDTAKIERVKSATKTLSTVAEAAPAFAQRSADLDVLARVISKTNTGRGAPLRAALDAAAAELGLSSGTLATQADLIGSITQRIAPTLRATGSGSQSDTELRGFLSSLNGLAQTPQGNQLIATVARRTADIDNQRADIAQQWQSGDIDEATAIRRLSAINRKSIYASQAERDLIDSVMGARPQSGPTQSTGWGTIVNVR
jgi:hypothetical protein